MIIVDLHLHRLGIIEGDAKRQLEVYVDSRLFSQREDYDEYTVDVDEVKIRMDIKDLFILSSKFDVRVGDGWVELEELL
jgi:hypothetical protein